MTWKIGAALLVSLALCGGSPTVAPPCACPFNLRPVCGSDGVTYDSDCMLECLNPRATVQYRGECGNQHVPCVCTLEDAPVCGTNDRTYPNECSLNCDKQTLPDLAVRHTGACKEKRNAEERRCACPFIHRPVCGSDGVTYDNDCMLQCLNPSATAEYRGECGNKYVPCICTHEDKPVCGTNDRTYPNECFLNCEKTILADLTVRHTGACKEKRSTDTGEKQCVCPLFNLRPICASDGRTYDSECDMECQNPNATVEFYGACENRDLPPCICEDDDSPVCGTNDRTYPNECELNCDKSVRDLTLAHKGACKHQRSVDVNRCSCPAILRPVCGSDGVTYDNDCILKCMNPSAKLEYYGGCGDKEGPPCLCPDLYSPVCGTNDRTYPNECDLKCDKSFPNLAMKHTGVCKTKRDAGPENCGCPLISRPVCGSDGVTYDNDCQLKCKNPGANLDYHGRCGQIESVCVCPDNYEPVCGTNSRTYSNECELKCDKSVSVLYPGVCKTKRSTEPTICACPFISRPVCASDGKTYDTDCEMRCEDSNLKVLHEGPCKTKRSVKPELCSCPAILLPVCGTDGVTYPNDCLLKCQNPSAKVRANGPCKSKRSADDVPCGCSTEIKPVCGNDGKTYSNPCEFNCEKSRTNQENLHIWHNGSCETGSDCTCTLELDAVCGSDGKIYPNPCMFECAKKKNPELSQRNRGPCKAISKRSVEREEVKVATPSFPLCDCRARIKKEVCGTDGVTYVNDCFLDCAKTSQPTLTEAHKGPCEDKVTVVNNVPNERTPCVCLERILHEVCGTDGETYANDCFFDCAKTKNKELGKAHEGRCDAVAVVGA